MGTFYVVGSPIGNLGDLTLRAVRILGQVGLVAAEDTRVTLRLLNHLELRVPLLSCHRHNWSARLPRLLQELESKDVALVTDAGMPGVSDPGSELTARIAAAGFRVEVIPGPSAVTAALAASGLPADNFLFLGFLPRRRQDRQAMLATLKPFPFTLVIFEAPHRLRPALTDLLTVLGDRPVAVCRELTKFHEEVRRSSLSDSLGYFTAPRGEFTLVVAGAGPAVEGIDSIFSAETVEERRTAAREQLRQCRREGKLSRESIAETIAATGLPRRQVYGLWLETGGER